MSKRLLVIAIGDLADMITMLNDKAHNQFFDKLFKRNLKGGKVLDVGFGTGFTSLLAVKHGAISVDAYEQKVGRYEMGKELIEQLGYNDKIQIINSHFYDHLLKQNYECMVHEVMGEYMYYTLRNTHIPIFPTIYELEISSFPVVDNFANASEFQQQDYFSNSQFDLGVEFPENVRIAKEKVLSEYQSLFSRNKLRIDKFDCTMMPPIEKMDLMTSYSFDHNKRQLTTLRLGEKRTIKYNEMLHYVQLDFSFSKSGFYGLWLDFRLGAKEELFSTTENYSGKYWDGYRDGGNQMVMYATEGETYKFSQDISNGSYLFSRGKEQKWV